MFCLPVPTLTYLWDIYIFPWSAYSDAGKYVDWSWEYINHLLTHEWTIPSKFVCNSSIPEDTEGTRKEMEMDLSEGYE
jgi:hypothetical protein